MGGARRGARGASAGHRRRGQGDGPRGAADYDRSGAGAAGLGLVPDSHTMEFHVITLFPELFAAANWPGIVGRALGAGLVKIEAHALREHGLGNYRQVDDTPYGGGSGMVLRPEPLFAAIESTLGAHPGLWRILLTPQGEPLDQAMVRELSERRPG